MCLLAACSGPVEIPPLPGPETPPSAIVFHPTLSARDIQALFQSLNRNHRLDALHPFLGKPAPETLAPIGALLSRHAYETVFDDAGLISLVGLRANARDWTRLRDGIDPTGAKHLSAVAALASLVGDARFLPLVSRDVGLLSTDFAAAWEKASTQAKSFHLKYPVSTPALPRDQWIADAERFLTSPATEKAGHALASAWTDGGFGTALVKTLARRRAVPGAFEGFGVGIARLASTLADPMAPNEETKLGRLLRFFSASDGPTDGLFRVAQEKLLREPHVVRELTSQLQYLIPHAVLGFVKENLSQEQARNGGWLAAVGKRGTSGRPSAEWISAFIAIRTAVENVAGAAADDTAPDALLRNLPLYLNSYALTRWLEHAASSRAAALEQPVTLPPFSLSIAGPDAGGKFVLDPTAKTDWQALGLDAFLREMETLVQRDGFGEYTYPFAGGSAILSQQLSTAVDRCHDTRPFADGAATLRAIVFGLSREQGGFGVAFSDLESANLMDEIHQGLAAMSLATWRKMKGIVFDDMKLGALSEESKQVLLSLYEGHPKLQSRARALLETIGAVADLDRADRDLPSPFETYHALLGQLPGESLGTLTAGLRFLDQSKLLAFDKGLARYPSALHFLKSTDGIARLFQGLSSLSPREREAVLAPVERAFGSDSAPDQSGLRAHVGWISSGIAAQPDGLRQALGYVYDEGWATFPTLARISARERRWVSELVEREELATAWRFVGEHGGRQALSDLSSALVELEKSGYLAEAIDVLGHLQSERMRELSRRLSHWHQTGELRALLELIDALIPKSI